jgi:hypothetical protein
VGQVVNLRPIANRPSSPDEHHLLPAINLRRKN